MKPAVLVVVVVVAGVSAGSACAQSAAGVFDVRRAGLNSERGCDGCGARIDSGLAGDLRIGVRGNDNVGGGVSAIVVLETGLLPDKGRSDQDNLLFGRQAYVGLLGHSGAVTVGRQRTLAYLTLVEVGDPFKGGVPGGTANLMSYSGRQVDNSVNVVSREVHGVSAGVSYGTGAGVSASASAGAGAVADTENRTGNRAWGVSVGFERGPLTIRAAHQNRNVAPVAPATPMGNNLDAKNSIVAANLRLGSATAYAAFSATRGWGSSPLFNPDNPYSASMASTASLDSRDVLVGLALPCGPATLLASFIRKNDRGLSNRDANQIALGASYTLSRRTDFYASYSRITNRNNAHNLIGNLGNPASREAGASALNLGMRHGF